MKESTTTSLPMLNLAELRAIFRDDERAIWRYQILSALLHEGRTIGDVAEQFGTTAETVRQLRTTFFNTGDLDSLRSKRRGAVGHLGRRTPLALAVARELAADPSASANTIWRRIHEQFVGSGVSVPRRSIYRLVDRLRPQPDDSEDTPGDGELWPPALVPALRTSLTSLPGDSPQELGRSKLAEQLLPAESDLVRRGRLLRDLIDQSIASIGPGAGDDPRDIRFRPYHILIGESVHGRSRDELQQELAIAPATYTRAKRQGLERVAESLVGLLRQQQRASGRAQPPSAPPLLGRDRELRLYMQRLARDGVAVIWGLPGCGKTALASTIAAHYQAANHDVIWHDCAGSGEEILARLLDGFGKRLPAGTDVQTLLNELRASLRAGGGLLVLDSYERIAADPLANVLIAAIRSTIEPYGAQVLVCSRSLPVWAQHQGWLPLGGLAEEFIKPLWTSFGGPALDTLRWPMLQHRTLGYPRLLRLLIDDAEGSFEAALLRETSAGLSSAARQLLYELLLAGQPLTLNTAHITSGDAFDITPTDELLLHGLITREAARSAAYLHPLLEANRDEMQPLIAEPLVVYRRLAERASSEQRWLDAAYYLVETGEQSTAMSIIGEHWEDLISARQAHATIGLLHKIMPHVPPGPALAEAQGYLGAIYAALGHVSEAIAALNTAIDLSRAFQSALCLQALQRWQRLIAEIYIEIGEWRRALVFAQASMGSEQAIKSDVSPSERLALTLLLHRIWLQAGEADRARYWLADAQMLAQIRPEQESIALVALAEGIDAAYRGGFAHAVERLQRSLDHLSSNARLRERCTATALLARSLVALGDLDRARPLIDRALDQALTLEHRLGIVELSLAESDLSLRSGDLGATQRALATAERWLDDRNRRLRAELELAYGRLGLAELPLSNSLQRFANAITIASDPPIDVIRVHAMIQIAQCILRRGDATTAAQYASTAARQAEAAGLDRLKSQAQLCLAQEAILRCAFDEARSALEVAAVTTDDPPLLAAYQQVEALLNATIEQIRSGSSMQSEPPSRTGGADSSSPPEFTRVSRRQPL